MRLLASAACLALLIATFARAADPAAAPDAEFVDPSSAEARPYRSAGEYAIDRLVVTMITDSAAAVAKGKEVTALDTFHLRDLPRQNGTIAGLPRITALKMTSFKLRNPKNAPDAAEEKALQQVQYGLENGDPPRVLVQKLTDAAGHVEWRVYKPLANVRQCGDCHGDPEQMSPELRAALQAKYPNDEGTGFQPGEWRGIIRVTVAPPAAAAP